MYDLRIIHGQCYIDHEFIETNIYINSGKIAYIGPENFDALETIDAQSLKVLPGFIDPHTHLHLNIGSTYSSDDFFSGSQLAAYGGITTVLDFLDPIYNNDEFNKVFSRRLNEASESIVDYSFHCTFGNYKDKFKALLPNLNEAGITSVKVFTTYSDSDRRCGDEKIKEILSENILMMAHAEKDELIKPCSLMTDYEASRSEKAEYEAIKKLLSSRSKSSKLYIVHISSGHTLLKLNDTPNVYFESCPQYFYLSKDLFLKEDGKKYLLAPPLRSDESISLMKKNFYKLDTIGTDHCPFMLDEKMIKAPVDNIPKGLGSLGYAFQLMYSIFGIEVIPKFTENPAKIFKLDSKGYLRVGMDADIALIEEGKFKIESSYSKCDFNVYDGIEVKCRVKSTIRTGKIIMQDGKVFNHKGRYIRRAYEGNN